jgi:3-methylfumaryl-CoA hydratase
LIQASTKIKHGRQQDRGASVNTLDRAREWLGRVDVRNDVAAPSPLAALYDLIKAPTAPPGVGDELPALAHWLYFSPWVRVSETNESGDYRDPSLPPIELPRRLCIDSRIEFHRPIRVGDAISRVMRVVDIAAQQGSAGPLVTLLLRCSVSDVQGVAVSEERSLLYMSRSEPWPRDDPRLAVAPPEWTQEFLPDTRALFRYAALTHNMNRVHYDRPFATFVERHQGLVVPGEFVSALLMGLVRDHAPQARIRAMELKALRWLYDTAPLRLCARRASPKEIAVWAEDQAGKVALDGRLRLADDAPPRK